MATTASSSLLARSALRISSPLARTSPYARAALLTRHPLLAHASSFSTSSITSADETFITGLDGPLELMSGNELKAEIKKRGLMIKNRPSKGRFIKILVENDQKTQAEAKTKAEIQAEVDEVPPSLETSPGSATASEPISATTSPTPSQTQHTEGSRPAQISSSPSASASKPFTLPKDNHSHSQSQYQSQIRNLSTSSTSSAAPQSPKPTTNTNTGKPRPSSTNPTPSDFNSQPAAAPAANEGKQPGTTGGDPYPIKKLTKDEEKAPVVKTVPKPEGKTPADFVIPQPLHDEELPVKIPILPSFGPTNHVGTPPESSDPPIHSPRVSTASHSSTYSNISHAHFPDGISNEVIETVSEVSSSTAGFFATLPASISKAGGVLGKRLGGFVRGFVVVGEGKGEKFEYEDRELNAEERMGLWALAAVVAGGWALGGLLKPERPQVEHGHGEHAHAQGKLVAEH